MNKIFFFVLILFQIKGFGADTVIVLEALNSKGKKLTKDIVLVSEGSIIVNREKLSDAEAITQSDHLKNIASFNKNELTYSCESGVFKHILKQGKILKVEKGCLFSDRYKSLKKILML